MTFVFPLSIMPFRSNQFDAYVRSLSFELLDSIPWYSCTRLLAHLVVRGHLGCLKSRATMNNSVMSPHVYGVCYIITDNQNVSL